jgi:hypothetical protein
VDFVLNPIAQIADADGTRVFVLQDRGGCAVAWKAFLQGPLLVFGLEPRYLDGVARRELALVKRLLRWESTRPI